MMGTTLLGVFSLLKEKNLHQTTPTTWTIKKKNP